MTQSRTACGGEALFSAGVADEAGAGATPDASPGWEAARIDRLIELVLAFEPVEVKQSPRPGDAAPGEAVPGDAMPGGTRPGIMAVEGVPEGGVAAQLAGSDQPDRAVGEVFAAPGQAESTVAMLGRMRAVLDREAARLDGDGIEGKAAVDHVALIARTLEKIDQLERLMAGDRARTERQTLSTEERAELRQTVRQLILAAAERLAAERGAGRETMADQDREAAGETFADARSATQAGAVPADDAGAMPADNAAATDR